MDGPDHHRGGDGRDVPRQEEEDERAAHHVEERNRTERSALEDRHPPGGDAGPDAHDQVEDEGQIKLRRLDGWRKIAAVLIQHRAVAT